MILRVNAGKGHEVKKFIAFLIAATTAIALVPATASSATLGGLYNQRYCEIFLVGMPDPPGFRVDVYNTVGLNRCPARQWKSLDFEQIKTETGSIAAAPNGPRRWLIDKITGGEAGEPLAIGGLEMRLVATLTVPSLQPEPYTEMKIDRTTTWVYNKGRKLNFLISPKGRKYALQAYTTTIDSSLRARKLRRLGKNPLMALPKGWKYKTIKLKRKLRLKAPGVATILRDPLDGTYQRFRWPKKFFKPVKKKHHKKHRNKRQRHKRR